MASQFDNEEDLCHMDYKLELHKLEDHEILTVFYDQELLDLKIFVFVIVNVKSFHLLDYIRLLIEVDDSLRH